MFPPVWCLDQERTEYHHNNLNTGQWRWQEGKYGILAADQVEDCVFNSPSPPGAQHRLDT